jgi:hypothetical protein
MWLMAFRVDDGSERRVGLADWEMNGLGWLPDGRGLVATGQPIEGERSATATAQVWHISWPDGVHRRLTNDTNDHDGGVSVSADGRTVATSVARSEWSVWRAPVERPDAATRIARIDGFFGVNGWMGLVQPLTDPPPRIRFPPKGI